jgi:hypothetical protein
VVSKTGDYKIALILITGEKLIDSTMKSLEINLAYYTISTQKQPSFFRLYNLPMMQLRDEIINNTQIQIWQPD